MIVFNGMGYEYASVIHIVLPGVFCYTCMYNLILSVVWSLSQFVKVPIVLKRKIKFVRETHLMENSGKTIKDFFSIFNNLIK